MNEHLARLERSAAALELTMPADYARVEQIARALVRAGGEPDVVVRIFITRGPGGFSANPFECPASQLYAVASRLKPPRPQLYEKGASIISTPVPVKPVEFANIKSGDYLGNVFIKKAALQAGVDFAVNWDENGHLAEGSTENIFLVSEDRELLVPEFEHVLRGVTVTRVLALAESLLESGLLSGLREARITREIAAAAREVMVCGTTLDVVPVTRWDGRPVGDGVPGPAAGELLRRLREDIAGNPEFSIPLL
jgi:branched-chain amino acid aminotransferase